MAMDEKYPIVESQTPPDYAEYLEAVRPTVGPDVFHPYILDEGTYHDIVTKPSVIINNAVPLAVALHDAGELAHQQRCLAIANSLSDVNEQDIYFATAPGVLIADNIDDIRKKTGRSLLFMEADLTGQDSEHELRSRAAQSGAKLHTLEHPKLHSQAALNMFELGLSVAEAGSIMPIDQAAVRVKEGRSQDLIEAGVVIKAASELTQDDLNDLWDLFSERFTDISDNLPVKLEETEEATKQLMKNPDYTFIYKKGEGAGITACLFITDKPESYPWINEDFIRGRQQAAESEKSQLPYVTFIPGIAAERSSKGSTAAGEVLMWLTEVLKETNQPSVNVDFECTDVSSRYIPMISMRAARRQPAFTGTAVEQIGQKKYYALEL